MGCGWSESCRRLGRGALAGWLGLWLAPAAGADVFQWEWVNPADPGQGRRPSSMLCPGGAGVVIKAGANLSKKDLTRGWLLEANLKGANLAGTVLADAYLQDSILVSASLSGANLTGADLSGADLSSAYLGSVKWTGANLADAVVYRTSFERGTLNGLTAQQLYSTASYKNGNLTGLKLPSCDISGWNFSDKNLAELGLSYAPARGTDFSGATLTAFKAAAVDFTGATMARTKLTGASLRSCTVTGVDFTDAQIGRIDLGGVKGMTADQLYSTADYKRKDLNGINLSSVSMQQWNLSGQNFQEANIGWATLNGADLAGVQLQRAQAQFTKFLGASLRGAWLEGANFQDAEFLGADLTDAHVAGALLVHVTPHGFTSSQLYSSANYKAKDLRGILLSSNDLKGWDFSGQNLQGAGLNVSNLQGVSFNGADLRGCGLLGTHLAEADLTDALVTGASFDQTTENGFTARQLYSTASYRSGDLRGISLVGNTLSGWNLSGKDLRQAQLWRGKLIGTQLQQSNLERGSIYFSDLTDAQLQGTNLKQVDLTYCTFTRTDLSDACIAEADLTGSTMSGVRLAGADARGARGITAGMLATAGDLTNLIRPDGTIEGLALEGGRRLVVRNYQAATPIPIRVKQGMTAGEGGSPANRAGFQRLDLPHLL
ncbi:MAG TPA: pentapeptide repeat-containing protein [Tepidisphaeraceae bacterium]|nr:pentapeptide repeat-containing protein [Tepidisphaeraceae bacterium]